MAVFARSLYGATACNTLDRPTSSSSAVQAHQLSSKAVRSSQAAETAVPPWQRTLAVQFVSA